MKKTLFLSFASLVLCNGIQAQAAVIDPSNLAQNIFQVIQSKIESKLTGDAKDIADSQLKTESQSTADIIGMNSSVKTALNLEMAEFNYENSPSALYKTYYQNLDVRGKNYNILSHLQRVKAYYQSNILSIISPVRNDAYIKRFNALAEAVSDTDLLYAEFTNTVDNGSGSATSLAATQGGYNSTVQSGSSLAAQADTRAIQKAYDKQFNNLSTNLSDIEKARAEAKQKLQDAGVSFNDFTATGGFTGPIKLVSGLLGNDDAQKYGDLYNSLTAQSNQIQDQMNDLTYDLQGQISSAVESVTGGLGGLFGGNASEKGKGQSIQVNAPMGRMSDAQRIELATKSFKNLEVIDYQVTALENELKAIRADYDLKKYVDESKFSTSGFYENSGAMDYTKMMNFDKE